MKPPNRIILALLLMSFSFCFSLMKPLLWRCTLRTTIFSNASTAFLPCAAQALAQQTYPTPLFPKSKPSSLLWGNPSPMERSRRAKPISCSLVLTQPTLITPTVSLLIAGSDEKWKKKKVQRDLIVHVVTRAHSSKSQWAMTSSPLEWGV